jgi:hypothetical protein
MGMRGHRRLRQAAAATAVVCGLGAGALAGATSASAGDQLWVQSKESDLTLPSGVTDPAGVRQLHIEVSHGNDIDLPPATVTVDTGGLAGIADVVWPKECTHTGAVGTCTVKVTNTAIGDDPAPATYLVLGLNPVAGAKDGAQGQVSFTAVSGNLTSPENAADIHVGSGADLVIQPLKSLTGVKPGSTVTQQVVWKNTGNEAVRQTVIVMHATVGLDFAERYSNCRYGAWVDGIDAPAVCTVDTPLAPGQAVRLSSDLGFTVDDGAWQTGATVEVLPPGPEADDALSSLHSAKAGSGPALTAEPVASRTAAKLTDELNPRDNWGDFSVRADNHAHYYAVGAQVRGDKGDTVPVTVGLGNEGPATTFDRSGGDGVDLLKVTFPKGTTVTKVPAGCSVHWRVGVKAHGPYLCPGALLQSAGYKRSFTFQVRLDDRLADAHGTAALTNENSEIAGVPVVFPWDTGTQGYTQPIVFNGPVTPTATASAEAPGTGAQLGSTSPELAATGSSSTPLLAGAAALLLASGGAVTLTARRRTAARR